jgi:hypothetical protein
MLTLTDKKRVWTDNRHKAELATGPIRVRLPNREYNKNLNRLTKNNVSIEQHVRAIV